jgi:hypothetical protein
MRRRVIPRTAVLRMRGRGRREEKDCEGTRDGTEKEREGSSRSSPRREVVGRRRRAHALASGLEGEIRTRVQKSLSMRASWSRDQVEEASSRRGSTRIGCAPIRAERCR